MDRSAAHRASRAALEALHRALVAWLNAPAGARRTAGCHDLASLRARLRPGDVILVSGHTRFARLIQCLSGCPWSHVAIYTGPVDGDPARVVVEADVALGVRALPLEEMAEFELRIVRPIGLDEARRARLIEHLRARIGHAYDLKHVIDLACHLLPLPAFVQRRLRRGGPPGSGDPAKAICSTLLAQAFLSVGLPIVPLAARGEPPGPSAPMPPVEADAAHHLVRWCTPRDFALSAHFSPLPDAADTSESARPAKAAASAAVVGGGVAR